MENKDNIEWLDELQEKFPVCPDPINYPNSAEFYLAMKKYLNDRKEQEILLIV